MNRKEMMIAVEAWKPQIKPVILDGIGEAHVREITRQDLDSYQMLMADEKRDRANFSSAFAVRVLCDENGNRLFSDQEEGLLYGLGSNVVETLWEEGRKLSGLDLESQELAEKNSDAAQSDYSNSD